MVSEQTILSLSKKYKMSTDRVRKIIDILKEYNLKLEPHIFKSADPNKMKENAEYIVSNFGVQYVTANVLIKKIEKLKESMPAVKSLGLLPYTSMDSSIFDLNKDEIFERAGVLIYLSKPAHKVTRYTQVDRIDKIFTLSKESYEDYCYVNCVPENVRHYQKMMLEEKVKRLDERKRRFNLLVK